MHSDPEHHIEPPRIGRRWFDVSITVCILVISLSSLIVAIVHSHTLEKLANADARLVQANSWPYLGYGTGNTEGPNHSTIELRVTNDGVGPAKIETAELKWNGKPQSSAADFLHACCGYTFDRAHDRLWMDLMTGRVLRAGETINFITLFRLAGADPVWDRLNRARLSPALSVNVCYCSVFDECWVEDVPRLSLSPRRVELCATPHVPFVALH